jgi:hypothetical protein
VVAATLLVDERLQWLLHLRTRDGGGLAIAVDRRHQQMAKARAVKKTTTRVTKKVRAMRPRATRAMTETSLREEGDNGHNNQLSTKVAAAVKTVVVIYGRRCKMDGSSNQDERRWQDQDGQRQRRWATAAQRAAEWQI